MTVTRIKGDLFGACYDVPSGIDLGLACRHQKRPAPALSGPTGATEAEASALRAGEPGLHTLLLVLGSQAWACVESLFQGMGS